MAKVNSLVFIDFETGGLNSKYSAVTEVAAIAIKGDTLEKIDLVSTFISPYGEFVAKVTTPESGKYYYEEEALKFTGITLQDLETGISVKEAVGQIIDLLKRADLHSVKGTKPVLVAHNSAFDKGFLIQLFDIAGKLKELEKLTYGVVDYFGNYQPEMLDTIILSKLTWGAEEDVNFKLTNCMTRAGVELADGHRAVNDTIGLKDMTSILINKLRSSGGAGEAEVKVKFRDHFQF